jgi:four helix bundle protein
MAIIRRFQDLRCWQEARKLVNFFYKLTQHEAFSKEYELKGQLRKTAISIMNNIAEGFSRFNRNDFMRFLDYSQSSASELLSMTYVLEDMKMIN